MRMHVRFESEYQTICLRGGNEIKNYRKYELTVDFDFQFDM